MARPKRETADSEALPAPKIGAFAALMVVVTALALAIVIEAKALSSLYADFRRRPETLPVLPALTLPGPTQLTVTPPGPRSRASVLVNPPVPAFEAA